MTSHTWKRAGSVSATDPHAEPRPTTVGGRCGCRWLRVSECRGRKVIAVDVEDFWRFLERSAEEVTDLRQRAAWLEQRLSRTALDHVVDFQVHLDTARRPIDTYDMWGAANQVMDGLCSGDAFWYFQPWLIGQGQRWWRRACQDPDNLADVPAVRALAGRGPHQWADTEWPHWEELADVAARVYDTGHRSGRRHRRRSE